MHSVFVLYEDRARLLTVLHERRTGDHGCKLKWGVQTGYREKHSPWETAGQRCRLPREAVPAPSGGSSPHGTPSWAASADPGAERAVAGTDQGPPELLPCLSCPAPLGYQMHASKCYELTGNLLSEVKLKIRLVFPFFLLFFFNRQVWKEASISHLPNRLASRNHRFRLDLAWWSIKPLKQRA